MIGVAPLALLSATIQHNREMKALRARYPANVPRSTALPLPPWPPALGYSLSSA